MASITTPTQQITPTRIAAIRSVCKESFADFCKLFWETLPGVPELVWNWHLDLFCEELQYIAERVFLNKPKEHDLLCNVSPGSSKSSVWSILFNAWVWTRMAEARFIVATNTERLALDLAYKTKMVIESDLYRQCFPEVQIQPDRSAKGDFSNTCGGERLSCTVGGQSPIGRHAHFLICLPYETKIITNIGELPIGEIVEKKLAVKVLSYDHNSDKPVWGDIEEHESSPGRDLCRITFSDGTYVEATHEHPIYVNGRGYVPAASLIRGDEVINVHSMCSLPEEFIPSTKTFCSIEGQESFLLDRLLQGGDVGRVSSCLQAETGKNLLDLPEGIHSHPFSEFSNVLFICLSREASEGGETSQISEEGKRELFLLWQRDDASRVSDKTNRIGSDVVLQQRVCQQGSFYSYEREEKPQLYSWSGEHEIPRFISDDEEEDFRKRFESVYHVRQDGAGEWGGVVGTSHRLGQDKQRDGEFSNHVSELSYRFSGRAGEAFATNGKVVSSVELSVRIPRQVFNLRVSATHNYFANGVLVHNCDDPLDPTKALSEVELESAKIFMEQVLPSRKVRTNVDLAVTCLIMQRLHMEDPAGIWIKKWRNGKMKLKWICIPAEIISNERNIEKVHPPSLIDNYRDGLMDPVRLPISVLDERREDNLYAYAGQFLQNPTPLEGGMFKYDFFKDRKRAAPYNATRVRGWDRACLVAGTKVETLEGLKNIEDITTADLVLTREGYKKVLWAGTSKEVNSLTKVTFDNGSELIGTEDHPIWTNNRGWVDLALLLPDDCCVTTIAIDSRLFVTKEGHSTSLPVQVNLDSNVPVYDLTVEGVPEFYANGILVHNSSEGKGCRTAGVLMAKDDEGHFYVEHVVVGQWEPYERNEIMLHTARMDRARYGPNHEPIIYVEAEGGSSGRDAWKAIARHLAGFPVREERVTGNKVARAESWSSALAAGIVSLIDNGESTNTGKATWNIEEYINEHCHFPFGTWIDLVDSSTLCFNILKGKKVTSGSPLRVITIGGRNNDPTRIVVCHRDEMSSLESHLFSLVIHIDDPEKQVDDLPIPVAMSNVIGTLLLQFADIQPTEYQDKWEETVLEFGKKPEELVMSHKHGKSLWNFILKSRGAQPGMVVLVAPNRDDRRALSIACGIADVLRISYDRIYRPYDDEHVKSPPNSHVHAMTKHCRTLVSP